MSEADLPPDLLAKHPELSVVEAALRAHAAGEQITARCPTCNAPVQVTEIPETGALVVACDNGHVLVRARRSTTDRQ
jgi:hypothetical protein